MRRCNRSARFISWLLSVVLSATILAEEPGYVPKDGFVPDKKAAIAVAQAILIPIYGEKQIASEKPFHAALDAKGTWVVEGSLPKYSDGGVAIIKIRRQDARVLYVMHGK